MKTKPKTKKPEAIFSWLTQSQRAKFGQQPVYTTLLWDDGSLSCNCPGWQFKRGKSDTRSCKHTNSYADEASAIFKMKLQGLSIADYKSFAQTVVPQLPQAHTIRHEAQTGSDKEFVVLPKRKIQID